MPVEESIITNADNQKLHCYMWKPDGEIKGLIYVAHGYAEHTGRFTAVAKFLNDLGLLAFGHDNLGHGKSDGMRVLITDFNLLSRDIKQHVNEMKKEYPNLPMFLFAQSFGASLAIVAMNEQPDLFDAAVLSATYIQVPTHVMSPFEQRMVKTFPKFLNKKRFSKVDFDGISHDKEVIQKYKEDPLVDHGGVRIGTIKQFLYLIEKTLSSMEKVTCPVFLSHGDCDTLSDYHGSHTLYKGVKSQDKVLKIYEKAGHELANEIPEIKNTFVSEVTEWIKSKLETK